MMVLGMNTSRFLWNVLSVSVYFRNVMVQSETPTITTLIEEERVEQYHIRNYTYPLQSVVPNTTGWKHLMQQRLDQIMELDDSDARYEGYYQTMHSALLVPNFTEYGFGLTKCPTDLLHALQQGIYDGLETATLEDEENVVEGPYHPYFIQRPDLLQRVLYELQSYTEAWVGIPLVAHQAYGFRLYRNESQLLMHVDRLLTHVISFILHIDSSDDAQPWPLYIEDFHGRTHEVILTPGDILFYESSKCFHGRPRAFNGSWYTSVFVHYYPLYDWMDHPHELEAHYAIPPHWYDDPPMNKTQIPLRMVDTAMMEPNCPNLWCRTLDTVQWGGPAEEGVLITPALERIPFHPIKQESYEEEEGDGDEGEATYEDGAAQVEESEDEL